MSYVNPELRTQFESLPIKMKNAILEKNVILNSVEDLNSAKNMVAKEFENQSSIGPNFH